ncbi:MAG: bifunctional hydroxymethylpyrimidine kinase/phosphomethylpyrimidine kinase [Verrucomicrobia bacterium]|nr:bifunctional hydroxymethylpyrimidine kinase/phosphomethylpyrimidine kinase [Verrucomicrobiota bacterium]MCG2679966.1 bifunctional hydroxymethylpyrimidine kinase/phosphomethylpyrimidine kinase [Kiritimatiellia bacterium]MBU4247091.1 bifunctional hydroxymethylpyrimidine kinase/phosphomethylpyrimidine kinase [Verrucomicrobiota bacterium]MBU4290249.1 bifunctional hydroxymethylpyrimidine kinase/phosphomethylpyrimidine kinase [Verrucomicrobiota bacterium]MBU4428138.1 bifunctional hydroxymethylpyri
MVKKKNISTPVALTIAGSDSGGGAGIQADLKTFAALGVFGTSAITCVTAQNPDAVTGIAELNADMVARQIRAVCDGFPVAAAKTGMLYSIPVILAVANEPVFRKIPCLVVDPVMVATSGAPLLRSDAIRTLCDRLLPRATVITPNLDEASVLCGRPINSLEAQEAAARELTQRFGIAAVIKGGHLGGKNIVDVLFVDGKIHRYSLPRLKACETHGTGCTFSAALTAFLARGEPLVKAVEHAKRFVHEALKRAVPVGRHYPLNFMATQC